MLGREDINLNFLTNLILINKILINKGQIKNNLIVETYISMLGSEDIGQVSAIMQWQRLCTTTLQSIEVKAYKWE